MSQITILYRNGIFTATRDGLSLGQGRTLETMLENATHQTFPPDVKFHAGEVMLDLFGPLPGAGNTQISTREP